MEDLELIDIYYVELGDERIKCVYINTNKKEYQIKHITGDYIYDVTFNASLMSLDIFNALVKGLEQTGFKEIK